MTIDVNKNGKTLLLAPEGRLDTTTAPELEAALKENLEGAEELIFNLEKLDYISSAGLRVLAIAKRNMKNRGSMKVTGVNEVLMEIFEITGFTRLLGLEE